MSEEAFRFERRGRSGRAALALGLAYALILVALLRFEAAWWLMALLALPTLPALWDFWRNPGAGIVLEADRMRWHSGRRHGELGYGEIAQMRFDTRWDLSVRVTAGLRSGKSVRLPYEALPPHRELEQALEARGLPVVRHHFTVF